MKLYQRIEVYLEQNPSTVMSYGALAQQMGSHPIAVGRAMRALGDRGRTDLCARVVFLRDSQ